MTRVLVVGDLAVYRQALSLFLDLQPDIQVVAQAGTLAEARQRVSGVDVMVLDIALPDEAGIELISELRRLNSAASMLVLSSTLDPAYSERALETGADAVLPTECAALRIADEIKRIRAIC
jgi:DNA-binding NarL/FixJ family response regulator